MSELIGNYWDWEYLEVPKFDLWPVRNWFRKKSWAPLYKRPRIRPKETFAFIPNGGYALVVTPEEIIDGFTVPLVAPVVTWGRINTVMADILWVAAVHDKACRETIGTPGWRADLFAVCVNHATEMVSRDKGLLTQVEMKLRAYVLRSGVYLGSLFGAC